MPNRKLGRTGSLKSRPTADLTRERSRLTKKHTRLFFDGAGGSKAAKRIKSEAQKVIVELKKRKKR